MSRIFVIIVFTCAIASKAKALDAIAFAEPNALGDTLYYKITDADNMTVKVVDYYIEEREQYYVYPDLRGTIVIPDTVKHGGQSFCVTEIGSTAFSENYGITEFYVPKTVTQIGYAAFAAYDAINIFIDEDNTKYTSVEGVVFSKKMQQLVAFPSGRLGTYEVPDQVTHLMQLSFLNTNLDTLILSDSLSAYTLSKDFLANARRMRSFRYPNSLKRLPFGCTIWGQYLEEIIFGSGLEYIGGSSFGVENKVLQRVVCLAVTPPETTVEKFNGSDTLTLYVPRKSIELYRQAKGWNSFQAISPIEPPVVAGVNSAEISWVTNADASGYTLTLYLDAAYTQRMVTLTFDEFGYLTNMDFNQELVNELAEMPNRVRQIPDDYEDNTNQEYHSYLSFTVTGLKANSSYYYVRQSLNGTEVIDEETGSFETLSNDPTGIKNNRLSSESQKMIKDGHVLIRNGKETYGLMGVSVEK